MTRLSVPTFRRAAMKLLLDPNCFPVDVTEAINAVNDYERPLTTQVVEAKLLR